MPLHHANVIDLIAHDPNTDEVVLGMTETRLWDESDRRVFELQEKVNAYLSFALDGEMVSNFPQFEQKRVRLHLSCADAPNAKVDYFLGIIREQIGFQGIGFSLQIVPELLNAGEQGEAGECCGGHCGCGSGVEPTETAHPVASGEEDGCCGCCGG